jgi:hypothetical protein
MSPQCGHAIFEPASDVLDREGALTLVAGDRDHARGSPIGSARSGCWQARLRPAHSLYSDSMRGHARQLGQNLGRRRRSAAASTGTRRPLALELTDQGHEVSLDLHPARRTWRGRPLHARRHPDWLGVRAVEIVNSPVMAPSIVQFRDPGGRGVFAPELGAAVCAESSSGSRRTWSTSTTSKASAPDALPRRGERAALRARRRSLYSLHNYHTICPQVYLLQGHRTLCT